MSTPTLTPSAQPAPAPRCEAAEWCLGHVIPGDTVHLSVLTDANGMPLWLRRVGDGPTVLVRGRAGRVLEWTPAQAEEVSTALLSLVVAASVDNFQRGIRPGGEPDGAR